MISAQVHLLSLAWGVFYGMQLKLQVLVGDVFPQPAQVLHGVVPPSP
jgi:hypothetical protein